MCEVNLWGIIFSAGKHAVIKHLRSEKSPILPGLPPRVSQDDNLLRWQCWCCQPPSPGMSVAAGPVFRLTSDGPGHTCVPSSWQLELFYLPLLSTQMKELQNVFMCHLLTQTGFRRTIAFSFHVQSKKQQTPDKYWCTYVHHCMRFIKRIICWLWFCILRCLCLGPREWCRPGRVTSDQGAQAESRSRVQRGREACFLWSHTGPVITPSFPRHWWYSEEYNGLSCQSWPLLPRYTPPSAGF